MQFFRTKTVVMAIVCGALLVTSMVVRPGVAFDDVPGLHKCVWSTNHVCATCENTNEGYQCSSAALPDGYGFGKCIFQEGICGKPKTLHCGQWTYNCQDPPKVILDDSTCDTDRPWICKK